MFLHSLVKSGRWTRAPGNLLAFRSAFKYRSKSCRVQLHEDERVAIAAVLSLAALGSLLGSRAVAGSSTGLLLPDGGAPGLSPAPENSAVAMRQDLEFLALLPKYDRSFTPEAAAKFEAERQVLLTKSATLTPAQLEMEVARLVAISGNGHTTVGRRLRRIQRRADPRAVVRGRSLRRARGATAVRISSAARCCASTARRRRSCSPRSRRT
jgi:hypothetical protein